MTPAFPQLSQYPLRKRRTARTVVNECPDGSTIRLPDEGAGGVEWTLAYRSLSDDELQALRGFFEAMEGRLGTFRFVDPSANQLLWSEDFTQEAWEKGPLLQFTAGIEDPRGGERAVRIVNTGLAVGRVQQTLHVAAGFEHCLSVYVRGDAVGLFQESDLGSIGKVERAGTLWRRARLNGRLPPGDGDVRVGWELEAGASLEVFGPQLEAQAGASAYRRSNAAAGVYDNARFLDDVLAVRTAGPNRHDCVVRVFAPAGGGF